MTLTQGQYSWILTIAGYNTWAEDYSQILPEALRAFTLPIQRPEWNDWGTIAFVADYKARRNTGRSYGFAYNTTRLPRKAIMHSGVSFSDYLVSDIGNGRLTGHPVMIFADAQNLTEEQVGYIQQHYQKNGNVLVFTFATALNTPGGFESNIKKLSGINVRKELKTPVLFQYADKKSDDALAKGFGMIAVERGDKIPLFYVDDAEATALAWHESSSEKVAAAVKRNKDWTGIYLANGCFTAEFPRVLAESVGVRPCGPLGDVTLAGNSVITLHATSDGMKTVHWNGSANLVDLTTGQFVAYETDHYKFWLNAGETRWFKRQK